MIKLIAEIANSHDGNFETLKLLVEVAGKAQADFVKFQLFKADELVTKNHPKYPGYIAKQFSSSQWKEVVDLCEKLKVPAIAETFDYPSFSLSAGLNFYGYKVHSTNLQDIGFIKELAALHKPVFLSVGGTYLEEIRNAMEAILSVNPSNKIILMNGFQSFPTPLEDTNLNRFYSLKKEFDVDIGLQDHLDGSDELSRIIPFMAQAMGYSFVEKHFTLNRALKGTDYYSSLEPDELIRLKIDLGRAEKLFGSGSFEFSEKELAYRNSMKKKLVVNKSMKKGSVLRSQDISAKRSVEDGGLFSDKLTSVIGKKINKDMNPDDLIKADDCI